MNVNADLLAEPLRSDSLVSRAQAGDQIAFTRLINERHQQLYRTAWAILRNDSDALDATQEASGSGAFRCMADAQPRQSLPDGPSLA